MITIVSGLPRSGTSLMMQMLSAGGMRVQTDKFRPADEHNLRGYYEDRRVKSLDADNTWVAEADGAALKVVSLLLYELPDDLQYRVLFMRRNLEEVLRSQQKMLVPRSQAASSPDMRLHFERHLERLSEWLPRQQHLEFLEIEYRSVIDDSHAVAASVAGFLEQELEIDAMASVVDPSLYRQRHG